ncbi:hypothetical protein GQX74_015530 [Glossina fuscipes]|nr:hypothetical protein GQX74_015530 [Glossina fuscipes]
MEDIYLNCNKIYVNKVWFGEHKRLKKAVSNDANYEFKSNYPRSIRATLPRNAIAFIIFAHASAGIVGTSATPSIRRENDAPKSLAGRNRRDLDILIWRSEIM